MYLYACIVSAYACETLMKSENAGCCCRGNHLSPLSSLTLSPQHFLFTFCLCIIVISHLLMFYHPICPSLCLQASLCSPALSLSLLTGLLLLVMQNPEPWATLYPLRLDYSSSSCWPTCHVCTRALLTVSHFVPYQELNNSSQVSVITWKFQHAVQESHCWHVGRWLSSLKQ